MWVQCQKNKISEGDLEQKKHLSAVPILVVFPALIVHSELKSVHPGFPVAFIFKAHVN